MPYTPLTREQFANLKKAGYTPDKILTMEKIRKQKESVTPASPPKPEMSAGTKAGNAVFGALANPLPKFAPAWGVSIDEQAKPIGGIKSVVNAPLSVANLGLGMVDFFNPFLAVKGFNDAAKEVSLKPEDISWEIVGEAAKEFSGSLYETFVPHAIRKYIQGTTERNMDAIEEANQSMQNDPAQVIPFLMFLKGIGGKYASKTTAKVTDTLNKSMGVIPETTVKVTPDFIKTPITKMVEDTKAWIQQGKDASVSAAVKRASQADDRGKIGVVAPPLERFKEGVQSLGPKLEKTKTFKDVVEVVNKEKKTLEDGISSFLDNDKTSYPLSKYDTTFTKNGSTVSQNFVKQAVKELDQYYKDTKNIGGDAGFNTTDWKTGYVDKLKAKESSSLVDASGKPIVNTTEPTFTIKEVHDLARRYSKAFSKLSFDAAGMPIQDVIGLAHENTRLGLKKSTRALMEKTDTDPFTGEKVPVNTPLVELWDNRLENLYAVKQYAGELAKQVHALETKMRNDPMSVKFLRGLWTTTEIVGLGIPKLASMVLGVATKTAMEYIGRPIPMNALDLQKLLAKDLATIKRGLADTSPNWMQKLVRSVQSLSEVEVPMTKARPTLIPPKWMSPDTTKKLPIILNPSGKEEKK